MKAPSCTSCRLRRRKCDKQKPICGSCKELGIPIDLCTYKVLKTNTKVKDLKAILDETKLKNETLVKEKLYLKKLLEWKKGEVRHTEERSRKDGEVSESKLFLQPRPIDDSTQDNTGQRSYSEDFKSDLPSPSSNLGQFRSTGRKASSDKSSRSHSDSISWASLMSMEPKMKVLLSQIDRVINDQKYQLETTRRELKTPLKKASKLIHLRSCATAHALKLNQTDICDDIRDLLDELEKNLPTKEAWCQVLNLQFNIVPPKYVGFLHLDHNTYQQILNRSIHFENSGKPCIDIKLPQEVDRLRDLSYLLSYVIFTASHATQVVSENFPMSPLLAS